MESEDYADMFRFRLGDCVQYAEYPGQPHYVCQRRWTQRAILEPVVEYLLSLSADTRHSIGWAREADLAPWQAPE